MTRVVVITGASRGIGLELTKRYVSNGDKVFAGARDPFNATELIEFKHHHANLDIIGLDVADPASALNAAKIVANEVNHVDVLINNAGIMAQDALQDCVETVQKEEFMKIIETNSWGPINVTQAFLSLLGKATGNAKVINISSVGGSHRLVADTKVNFIDPNLPYVSGLLSYRVSKSAVNMITQVFHADLKRTMPHLAIVAVDPGWTQTEMGARGGHSPPHTVQESAAKLIEFIDAVTPAHSGLFYTSSGQLWEW